MSTILAACEKLEEAMKMNSKVIIKIIAATLQIIAIMLTFLI